MQYALIIIIVLICGGAYYDHTNLLKTAQDDRASDLKQIADLNAQVDKLQTDNKKLTDDNAGLTKNLTEAKSSLNDMTGLVQTAQKEADDAKKQLAQATATTRAPAAASSASPKPTNDLGTITTLDGKTYQQCQVLKIEADGITINHSAGITKILYGLLRPEMQKVFGYDPHVATSLTTNQVQLLEAQRKAGGLPIGK